MSKPKQAAGPTGKVIPADVYVKVREVMDELAYRSPTLEAAVMRIAKVCDFAEVMAAIKKRRIYAKKHKEAQQPAEAQQPRKAGKGKRQRRKDREQPQPPAADPGAEYTTGEREAGSAA